MKLRVRKGGNHRNPWMVMAGGVVLGNYPTWEAAMNGCRYWRPSAWRVTNTFTD